MFRAVFFDMGNVVLRHDDLDKRLLEVFRPTDKRAFFRSVHECAAEFCDGRLTEEEYWTKVANETGTQPPKELLRGLWTKNYDELTRRDSDVWNILLALKKKYKLGLISNSIPEHAEINRKRGLYDPFDVVVLSSEVGVSKDNSKIFLAALEQLHVLPEESIFIDDVQKYVDVAASLGITGILFRGAKRLNTELRKKGIIL